MTILQDIISDQLRWLTIQSLINMFLNKMSENKETKV